VIVDVIDKNFVLVTGPQKVTGVKRRRVNINHVEPTERKIKIERGENDEEIIQAIEPEMLNYLREKVKIKPL